MTRPLRIAYLLSHPIQYQSAMLRELSAEPDIDITVFYGLDTTDHGSFDAGFGRHVTWDVPLLDGYRHEFLPTLIPASRSAPSALRPLNRGLRKRLREGDFDLLWLHGWGRLSDLLALRDAKALGLPVLMRTENNFMGSPPKAGCLQGLKERLKRWVLESADAFGHMGVAGHAYFRAYGVADWKLFDMPYMVDNALWRRRADEAAGNRAELLERHAMEAGRPVILFVGKFQPRKRVLDLIDAYAQLPPDEDGAPSPYLLIVGSGEQQAEVAARSAELGWERIILAGFRNQGELPRYFELADLFVIPSANEQWGVVVNEAMNCRCAVISSDECGSAPELVIDGETGYTFPTGDIAALTERLNQALSDPEALAAMGERARERVATYGTQRILDGLRGAIAQLVRENKIRPAS